MSIFHIGFAAKSDEICKNLYLKSTTAASVLALAVEVFALGSYAYAVTSHPISLLTFSDFHSNIKTLLGIFMSTSWTIVLLTITQLYIYHYL